jgi:sugar porter (SP) family MFS transporter
MTSKRTLYLAALSAALGGFLFGFDTAVISGAEQSIQRLFHLTGFWHGFTVAIALIGTVIGALLAGFPADRHGRRRTLQYVAVLYSVSALGSALAFDWYSLLFFRFIGGLGVGASSVVGPMYISEIAPPHLRGRLVGLFQLNIVIGIFIAFISNYVLADSGEFAWRWMLGVETIPAMVFLVALFFVPRSPRWLVARGQEEEAMHVLEISASDDPAAELAAIHSSLIDEKAGQKEKLWQRRYRLPLMFAIVLALFNQLTGINAVMYFAPRIFALAGSSTADAFMQTVWVGLTNFSFTVLAMLLIDKFGRRSLMLYGSVGMMISLAMTGYSFLSGASGLAVVFYVLLFIASFAFSQGAVIWVFLAEIFPNRVRGKGQAVGSFTHWLAAAIISWSFPLLAETFGGAPSFLFFAAMMLLQLFFVWFYMPETKGKSLEEIEKDMLS